MNFFKRIFGAKESLKQCPRCLGKGHVDWDDIKRLNQELIWIPGTCAYCNGVGKVDQKIENQVPVDASYLVMDLPENEREKIIKGHPDALERGKQLEEEIDRFVDQVAHMHFEMGLTPLEIAIFLLKHKEGSGSYETEKQRFVDYIEKVIRKKKN